MKKNRNLYFFGGLIAVLGLSLLVLLTKNLMIFSKTKDAFESRPAETVLGYYNPNQAATDSGVDSFRHFVLKWNNADAGELPSILQKELAEKGGVLLTLEVHPIDGQKESYAATWEAILAGKYDEKIEHLCVALEGRNQPTYLRLNPEMEVPVNLLPWQNQSPDHYIKAFRHFAKKCKSLAPGAKIVWGPAGYPGALEYWPGEDLVDVLSLTIKSNSEELTSAYPKESSVKNIIRRKLHRIRFIEKPVLILASGQLAENEYSRQDFKVDLDSIRQYLTATAPQQPYKDQRYVPATNTPGLERVQQYAKTSAVRIGVYDPELELTDHPLVTIEHIFANLEGIINGELQKKLNEVVSRNHDVIVTLEPWDYQERKDGLNVLEKTVQGQYDEEFKELYRIASSVNKKVYLRFAHEMEIPIERYPWQSKDPALYIQAFRHFVNQGRPLASNLYIVWGPAGDRGSLEWWPGEEYVDYISIAIYGLPDKNITDHQKQESFQRIFKRKLHRMRFANKPIFITEFGVKGPDDYQEQWLAGAAQTIKEHPEVVGVCYFNQPDVPKAWGDIEAPDWSVSEQCFNQFAAAVTAMQ